MGALDACRHNPCINWGGEDMFSREGTETERVTGVLVGGGVEAWRGEKDGVRRGSEVVSHARQEV